MYRCCTVGTSALQLKISPAFIDAADGLCSRAKEAGKRNERSELQVG